MGDPGPLRFAGRIGGSHGGQRLHLQLAPHRGIIGVVQLPRCVIVLDLSKRSERYPLPRFPVDYTARNDVARQTPSAIYNRVDHGPGGNDRDDNGQDE